MINTCFTFSETWWSFFAHIFPFFFYLVFLHVALIAFELDCCTTWHRYWHRDLIDEWRNLITGEKLHWS